MPPSNEPIHLDSPELSLEVRSLEERTIYGRIIPYGETIMVRGRPEAFAPGSVAGIKAEDIRLLAHHDRHQPIGRGIALEERSDGAYATFKVSKTTLGDEMLELAKDGVLSFSPGFMTGEQDRNGIHRRLKSLPETSLVTFGSYTGAKVLAVREEEPMPPTIETITEEDPTKAEEIETRSKELEGMEVRMGELSSTIDRLASIVDAPTLPAFNGGPKPIDWFRAQLDAMAGRTEKREKLEAEWEEFQTRAANGEIETRALGDITGSLDSIGDIGGLVVEEFIGSQLVHVLNTRRRLFSRLGSFPMPKSGYAKIPVVTQNTEVGVRSGQKLAANSRKMIVTTEPFEAVWYDGAVDIALEVIRSADLSVVEMVWNDLIGQYAISTEAGLVSTIEAGGLGFGYTGTALRVDTYGNLMTDIATQAIEVEDGSASPATIVGVTNAQWIAIVAMADATGRRYFAPGNPTNSDGTTPINASSVTLAEGIEVFRVPNLTQAVITNQNSLKAADGGVERVEAVNVELMGKDLGVLGRTMFVPRIPAGVRVFGTDPVS